MARILVVDDEVDMRMALGNVLSRIGHQVFEAGDGTTALEFLGREGVDIVLLDIRMPGMDGVQILRKLRERDQTTPVIMVTGYGSVESAVEVMQLGASHYLSKPFSNRDLIEAVERVLRERGAPGSPGKQTAAKPHGAGSAAGSGTVPFVPVGPYAPGTAGSGTVPFVPVGPYAPGTAGSGTVPAVRMPVSGGVMPAARRPWSPVPLLLGAAILALAVWGLMARSGRDVRLPFKNPTAVAWRGDRLWAADWVTQTVYEGKISGGSFQAVKSYALPQTHITGLAVADGHLYLSDSWRQVIQKRKLDDKLSLVASTRSPGPSPAGLFFDGRYLWSADSSTREFYQHELDGPLTVLAGYAAPGRSPVAVYKDDRFFWSADSETRLLYQHRLDNKLGVMRAYSLPQLDPGPAPLSTFTWKGPKVWLGRDGSEVLLERSLTDFVKSSGGGAR